MDDRDRADRVLEAWSREGRRIVIRSGATRVRDSVMLYDGSCHCGRVRFRVEAELDHATACDCSICRRRGALNHRVEEDALELLTPIEELVAYRFHTRQATDYFCPECGISPFRRPRTAPHLWAVNLRCLEGVDLDSIPVYRVQGSRLP